MCNYKRICLTSCDNHNIVLLMYFMIYDLWPYSFTIGESPTTVAKQQQTKNKQ